MQALTFSRKVSSHENLKNANGGLVAAMAVLQSPAPRQQMTLA
jgi:hypothetical protein